MWLEYPGPYDQEDLFTENNQFMFGQSILVAPKIGKPQTQGEKYTDVVVTLPESDEWFYFYSKLKVEPVPGATRTFRIPERESAVFVKNGSILPLLKLKERRHSLLESFNDPLALEIYPTSEGGEIYGLAYGDLYLD